MEHFPTYTFPTYWKHYLIGTFSWEMYFRYLMPVFILGYLVVNISLVSDYLRQRQEAQDIAEAEAAQTMQKALALSATFTPKPTIPSPYLAYLKGKNSSGELDFPVNDVYYFTIEDRFYYAESVRGRYLVGKTLNDLETELDPSQFFRIKRDYIVNRQAVLNYAYWENGKYIVRLNTPDQYNIVVPRARMHEFREWLQGRYDDVPEQINTTLL
ncbi:LytTR family DNA-binding domain-containing protein [Spirosoma sp.]|uniref:LytTR family DNA-binding domain-containing protein n=1 Tax=Spirosoma sp. TaxID=1899569 RepID=UPI003B3B1672